ncbi:MAG: sporulation transcriptional regulator SpoIIID [Clostridia bacterium]|nr:sporulation transcriptional regulator SpoIIID [Clostridia bacterium]
MLYQERAGVYLYYECDERARELGRYILENKATVRQAAAVFKISKSTVHKDVSQRLQSIDHPLFLKVKAVLDTNLKERHIRGGIATRNKYEQLKKQKNS